MIGKYCLLKSLLTLIRLFTWSLLTSKVEWTPRDNWGAIEGLNCKLIITWMKNECLCMFCTCDTFQNLTSSQCLLGLWRCSHLVSTTRVPQCTPKWSEWAKQKLGETSWRWNWKGTLELDNVKQRQDQLSVCNLKTWTTWNHFIESEWSLWCLSSRFMEDYEGWLLLRSSAGTGDLVYF